MLKVSFPDYRPTLDLGSIEKTSNTLEFKTIVFTVALYLFVCISLFTVHRLGPYLPKAPAILEMEAETAAAAAAAAANVNFSDLEENNHD